MRRTRELELGHLYAVSIKVSALHVGWILTQNKLTGTLSIQAGQYPAKREREKKNSPCLVDVAVSFQKLREVGSPRCRHQFRYSTRDTESKWTALPVEAPVSENEL